MPLTLIQPSGINSSANFTFAVVNATANLNVTGVSNLGPNGNIIITGGGNGDVLSTNGSGGLSWIPVGNYNTIVSGNSNVNIPSVNGNVTIGINGVSNTAVFSETGANFSGTLSVTGNGTFANISGGNLVTANFVQGTLTTAAQPNITSVGTLGSLTATGNITGNYFIGNGSQLTGLPGGTSISNGSSNVNIPAANGNVIISSAGNANVVVVTGTGINVAGTGNFTGNLSASNFIAGTGSGGNLSGANIISANTGNFSAGLNVTGVSNLGPIGNVIITGGSNGQVLTTNGSGGLSWANGGSGSGTSISNGNSNVNIPTANGNITMTVSGNSNVVVVTGTGINVAGTGNITGNLNAANVTIGVGSGGNLTGANVISANTFTGVLANGNSNVSVPAANGNVNISAVGNANVLVVTGTGINVAGYGNFTGNLNAPNITIGAGIGGNLSNANVISANTGNFAVNLISGGNLSVSGNAVISGNLTVDGNLIYVNVTDLSVEDPIIQLQTGPNGAAPASNTGKDVGTALNYYDTSAKIAFMGWDVSNAEIAFGANVGISSEVVTFTELANIRAGNAQLGNTVTANFISGVLTTASQPNITTVGTLGALTTSGNVSVGNAFTVTGVSNLGPVGNVIITGGSNGQVLTTNGSGGLSWSTAAGGGANISNGNSNVNIATANGNVTVSVAGNANVLTVTGTGANISGTFNTTGNLTVGGKSNLGSNSNVIITGGTNNQYLQTDGSGNLSWSTISNLSAISDTFTGNGVQTTFTLSTTPANINLTYVNYNGALLQRSSYNISGANVVFSDPPANGSEIEITTMAGSIGSGVAYSRTNFTATASQTVFNVVYVPGYIQVFYNGVLLAPSDYTATNGTTVTLADPATAGDLVEFVSFTTAAPVVAQPVTLNSTTLNSNLAITAGYSAVSAGPITIADGVSVTIASGQKWVIL